MKLLEKYYNERFKEESGIDYKDMKDFDKFHMAGTLGFAAYQATDAVKQFKKAVDPFIDKLGLIKD